MRNKIFVSIFALFLAIISIGTLVAPKKDFSDNENRMLAAFPEVNGKAIVDGKFTAGISDYFTDHILFRDGWVTLKTIAEKLMGKHNSGSIFAAKNGMLIQEFSDKDLEKSIKVLESISLFDTMMKDKFNMHVKIIISPTATQIYKEELHKDCYTADSSEFFIKANEIDGFIDLNAVLNAHKDENIFYRTDRHWSHLGAHYAYVEYCNNIGLTANSLDEFKIECVAEEFFGTTYSRYGLFDGKNPDKLETVSYDLLKHTTATVKGETHTSIFYPEKLQSKDKYLYFLGGNNGKTEVNTGLNTGRNLLLFKDSYANAVLPYLCFHFDNIIVIDMRYYPQSVFDLVEEYSITDTLLVYNINSLSESQAALLPIE